MIRPGRVAQSVGHLTRKSGVLGPIPGDILSFLLPLFSSPEPKAPGELIVWAGFVVRRPSVVRPQFQTTSPLKLLGRLQPNFIYSLQGLEERKVLQMVWFT